MQDSATDVKIGYHLFFMCLFRKISAHFNAIQGKIPRQKMATDWKNHLRGQMRDKFYKDLTRDINAEKTKGYTLDSTIDKASEGIRSLIKIIKEHTSDGNDHNVQLVIYFDEAHTLFKTAKNNDPLFFILLSVLNAYRKEPLFVIFLSTHLGPARSQLFTSTLPITKISFDCAPRECLPVQPYALTIADITQVPFMARFGRPL
ncbi:hypothetical protein PHLCEN_2v7891 [Hermanssonia centrifuga]|uniref:Uncharacterized protein n=1 Tax=Hermanssonia centrifuga TaxID=98765 RepID=A0A2R6NVA2_9APHY|nr:hypothetical protein PHLCEN_2v7891 [Hermanssonia centrifuga]